MYSHIVQITDKRSFIFCSSILLQSIDVCTFPRPDENIIEAITVYKCMQKNIGNVYGSYI